MIRTYLMNYSKINSINKALGFNLVIKVHLEMEGSRTNEREKTTSNPALLLSDHS